MPPRLPLLLRQSQDRLTDRGFGLSDEKGVITGSARAELLMMTIGNARVTGDDMKRDHRVDPQGRVSS